MLKDLNDGFSEEAIISRTNLLDFLKKLYDGSNGELETTTVYDNIKSSISMEQPFKFNIVADDGVNLTVVVCYPTKEDDDNWLLTRHDYKFFVN